MSRPNVRVSSIFQLLFVAAIGAMFQKIYFRFMLVPDKFRTIIKIKTPPFQISHRDRLMSIGSCFSENIGRHFSESKFRVAVNPFGQQYNPESVANAIQRLLDLQPYRENELVFHDELFHSFDHHGSYSAPDATSMLFTINQELKENAEWLLSSNVLFLTFGTAHVFRLADGKAVSNCHKLPASRFSFEMLSPEAIVEHLTRAITLLRNRNPDIKIVFTISPVRYFAFGHYENNLSKAHLFTAVNRLLQLFGDTYYFPAYEIVIDELRDYRFFAEDMLHPNHLATQYVWERTAATFFSKETLRLLEKIQPLMLAVRHRPRNPESDAHRKFIERNLQLCKNLEEESGLDFSLETAQLKAALK
ncbi:MAG: GSCFA domain-containing protein [Chitinophagales bacterium]